MTLHAHPLANLYSAPRITGQLVTDFSYHLLKQLAAEAHIPVIHISSTHRKVEDQARTFYTKHIVEGKPANYKNPAVAKIISHAKDLHGRAVSSEKIKAYLIYAIEHVHGGPRSVSTHLGSHVLTEVFDVAHYSGPTLGAGRCNYMTTIQAEAFLAACRKRMPSIISRLGHSAELSFTSPTEFKDEKCFHFEVKQLLYDRLELLRNTMNA